MSSEAIPNQFEAVDDTFEENVSPEQDLVAGDTKPQEFYYMLNTSAWTYLLEIINEELTAVREASKDLSAVNSSLEMYGAKRMGYDSIEAFMGTILEKVNAEAELHERELKEKQNNSVQ
jgi:hypothetical protein